MARANSRALLIGCDFYFAGADEAVGSPIKFPHLRGAVRDANDVGNFFVKIGVPKDNIVKLTASYDPHFPSQPMESDKLKWPTHANIVRELENITEQSESGTLVYIQFSGHGIQRGKVPEVKTTSGGDSLFGSALATTDVLENHGRYLTANELGLRVQAMVENKRLRVTVVLDACFSGRGLRKGASYTVRTIPDHQDNRDIESDRVAEREAFEYLTSISATRQAEIKEDWLSNPVGCTVLTACGMQQTAGEDTFKEVGMNTTFRQGVLTHWMLELLNQRTTNFPSYTMVKDYVINKIMTTSPDINQVPVLYGDADYEFFGSKRQVKRPACRVTHVGGNKVLLNIGSAQGVTVDSVYDMYPADVDIEDFDNFDLAQKACIVAVEDFSSLAMLTKLTDLELPIVTRGVLRSWALRDKVLVNFIPAEASMREELRRILEKTPNLILDDGHSNQESFTVTINQENYFEITERNSANTEVVKLQRHPAIAVDTELAIPKLAHVLRHISRYRDIEQLQDLPRPTRIQEEKLDIIVSRGFERLDATELHGVKIFEVVEGEELGLQLQYNGPAPLIWVTVFELSASWGIVRKFESKMSKGRPEPRLEPRSFSTKIPRKSTASDSDAIDDTFMVFMVEGEDEHPWDEIELEALLDDGGDLRMDAGLNTRSTTKGRNSNMDTRQAQSHRNWGVVSFIVHSSPSGN